MDTDGVPEILQIAQHADDPDRARAFYRDGLEMGFRSDLQSR